MRDDVKQMNKAVDRMWEKLLIGFAGMCAVVYGTLFVAMMLDDVRIMWLALAGCLPWAPWVKETREVSRLTKAVERENDRLSAAFTATGIDWNGK